MSCAEARPLLLDLALGGADAAVAAHVAGCPDCRAEVEALARVAGAVRALPAPLPSPALAARILARVSGEPAACTEARRHLVDLALGSAPAAAASHVATCAACVAEVDATAAVLRAVAALPTPEAPAGFAARIRRVAAGSSDRLRVVRFRDFARERIRRAPVWAGAIIAHAAAILVLTTIVLPVQVLRAPDVPILPVAPPPTSTADDDVQPEPPGELLDPGALPPVPPTATAPDPVEPPPRMEPEPDPAVVVTPAQPGPGPDPRFERAGLEPVDTERAREKRIRTEVLAYLGQRLDAGARANTRASAGAGPWGEPIARGLAWLRAAQEPDGSWAPGKHGGDPEFQIALTGLAVLAFCGEGASAAGSDADALVVGRAVVFLLKSQDPATGRFGPDVSRQAYNHGLAMLALAEVHTLDLARGVRPRESVTRPYLTRAVAYLARAAVAGPGGALGWGYKPGAATADTSITSLQVEALAATARVGIGETAPLLAGARAWLVSVEDGDGRYGYRTRLDFPKVGSAATMTAVGRIGAVLAGETPDPARDTQRAALLRHSLPDPAEPDRYAWWYATRFFHERRGADPDGWADWRNALGRTLLRAQQADGGWGAGADRYGSEGGRIYTTALAVCCLEVPSR